jgi:hypothetical protein
VEALNAEVVAYEKKTRVHLDKNLLHLKSLVVNLFYLSCRNPKRFWGFSRMNGYYDPKSRNNPVPVASRLVQLIDVLAALGYVETHKGHHDRKTPERSRQSRMRATETLVALFGFYGLVPDMLSQHPDSELIVLRPPKGHAKEEQEDPFDDEEDEEEGDAEVGSVLDYMDTDYTNQARANLRTINALLQTTNIDLPLKPEERDEMKANLQGKGRWPISMKMKTLKRIYNNSDFEQGGRFYGGWWETLPSEYRKRITINGMKTAEVDYSTMHPRILYAARGLTCPDAPYVIEGLPQGLRKVVKLALLIIINAPTRKRAVGALKKRIRDDGLDLMGYTLKGVMSRIEQTHEPIKEDFYTGKGTFLQRIDSDIAEQVMLHFAEQGVAVLPVHDSFIVGAWAEDALSKVMEQAFQTLTGQQGAVEAKWDNPVGAVLRSGWLRHLTIPD